MKTPTPHLPRAAGLCAPLLLTAILAVSARAQGQSAPIPKSWIDPDTGHRVIRLSDSPGSDSFYFNVNGYTPDGKEMAYASQEGIEVLNLATMQSKLVVAGASAEQTIVVGAKTPTVYYMKATEDPYFQTLWATNLDTGATRQIGRLPRRARISTINADETLGAGTYIEGDATAGGAYDGVARPTPNRMGKMNLGEAADKDAAMNTRLFARLPNTLFIINLQTGEIKKLIEHSTDWLNHLQFSPSDPTLLMYCHEGHWQYVDRIWTIRTDGTQNQLVHKRILKMETAGHEWWSGDGQTIWFQLRLPQGAYVPVGPGLIPRREIDGATYIAGCNIETGERTWYHYNADAGSIHHNSSRDGKLFCGDGNEPNPWIMLCRPVAIPDDHTLGTNLINVGYFTVERLVNMGLTIQHPAQNYRLEPNPSFTPDGKWIIFRANFFGPDYPFAVEVAPTSG
jgi:oligogalacturonide lyase